MQFNWMLKVYRYVPAFKIEEIEITEEFGSGRKKVHTDGFLRARSYTFFDDNGNVNKTSEAKFSMRSSTRKIKIKVRVNTDLNVSSFRIFLTDDPNARSWWSNILTMAITILASCLCCCIIAQCIKCYVNR